MLLGRLTELKKWKKKINTKQNQELHPCTYQKVFLGMFMFHWEQDAYFANTRFE